MFRSNAPFIIPVVFLCGCVDISKIPSEEALEEKTLHSGKNIYDDYCSSCHTPGLNGAPRIGDDEAWASRLVRGRASLLQSTIDGIQPVMPSRGICFDCSDEQLDEAIDYMIGHQH